MNRDQSRGWGTCSGLSQRPRVDALAHDDARIVAQPPIELPVADVERDDARRAALEQHVGEAPVEAPMSSARRPATSRPKESSARASLTPPRLTYG